MCDKEYNDIAKVCPLDHCPNCGSLKVTKQLSRRRSLYYSDTMFLVSFFVGMMALIGFIMINSTYPEYGFTVWVALFFCIFLVHVASTMQNFRCKSCAAKNFSPISSIKVKKTRSVAEEEFEHIEYQDNDGIMKKLDGLSENQSKHHKRSMILKVIGIIGSISIGITGLVLNPEIVESFVTELFGEKRVLNELF